MGSQQIHFEMFDITAQLLLVSPQLSAQLNNIIYVSDLIIDYDKVMYQQHILGTRLRQSWISIMAQLKPPGFWVCSPQPFQYFDFAIKHI